MANEKKFDYLIVGIGWQRYIMPAEAARRFFDACIGQEIYAVGTAHEEGRSRTYCELLNPEYLPRLEAIGPAQFFAAIEFGKELAERKAAEEAAMKAKP